MVEEQSVDDDGVWALTEEFLLFIGRWRCIVEVPEGVIQAIEVLFFKNRLFFSQRAGIGAGGLLADSEPLIFILKIFFLNLLNLNLTILSKTQLSWDNLRWLIFWRSLVGL